MKICKRCKQEKAETEFYIDRSPKNSKYGLRASCKKCTLEKNKLSRYKNWDKYLKYQNKRYHAQPEKNRIRHKIQWQKRKTVLLPIFKELRKENYHIMLYRSRLDRLAKKRIEEYRNVSISEKINHEP